MLAEAASFFLLACAVAALVAIASAFRLGHKAEQHVDDPGKHKRHQYCDARNAEQVHEQVVDSVGHSAVPFLHGHVLLSRYSTIVEAGRWRISGDFTKKFFTMS